LSPLNFDKLASRVVIYQEGGKQVISQRQSEREPKDVFKGSENRNSIKTDYSESNKVGWGELSLHKRDRHLIVNESPNDYQLRNFKHSDGKHRLTFLDRNSVGQVVRSP
jgi:hypothetical protein